MGVSGRRWAAPDGAGSGVSRWPRECTRRLRDGPGGGVLTVLALVALDLRVRPAVPDVDALQAALAEYDGHVPWMLRLSLRLAAGRRRVRGLPV